MKKIKVAVEVVIILCVIMALFGKLIRHTVMYESLVKPGIGWHMINDIVGNTQKFGLTIKNSYSNEEVAGAAQNACAFFSTINVFHFDTYYSLEVYITILWNVLFLIITVRLKKSFNIGEVLFLAMTIAVLNIFDFCVAKEPIQMLYFVGMYAILCSKKSDKFKFLGIILMYILCYATYRNYYILMAGFFIYLWLIYNVLISKINKVTKKNMFIIIMSIFTCYFIFLNIIKIIDNSAYSELIRVRLRESTAASDMRAIFKSDNLAVFTLDYIIMLVRMLFPIELVRMGPKYFIYFIYQIVITLLLIKNIKLINNISYTKRIALFTFMAFLMGSAAFEPDFGSWIRHEAVTFPVIYVMTGIKEIKNERELNEEKIL